MLFGQHHANWKLYVWPLGHPHAPPPPPFEQHWVLLLQHVVPAEQYEPSPQHTDPAGLQWPLQGT